MATKKGTVQVIQGATARYYHVLPSDLARATVSPEREAIFQYLARIGSDRFVDFIIDLLTQVEGHELVERTEGPGDEKQDILTLDPAGQRHLTQCKHTTNYEENTSGDELDLLFGACYRKNCTAALYVTNADLTPQAKRYVTDKEYARGAGPGSPAAPAIDFWNGRRIWERVSRSNAILNKWFSGMAQAHALRRFFTDLVVTRMPQGKPLELYAGGLAKKLQKAHEVRPAADGLSFDVVAGPDLTLNLGDWFRGAGDLGAPFLPPGDGIWLQNAPLKVLRVQALLSEDVGRYDVQACRDRIAAFIAAALPDPGKDSWWHLLATGPQAFVFLQDVSDAVLVTLCGTDTFVHAGGATMKEAIWATRPGGNFTSLPDPEDPEDEAWRHAATGITLRVLVTQRLHPLEAYELHLRQENLIDVLRTQTFRAVSGADPTVVDAVRRLTDPRWHVLQSDTGDLFWAYPPDAQKEAIQRLERVLVRRGVAVLAVQDKDRDAILDAVDTAPATSMKIVTGARGGMTPASLEERTFWLTRDYELKAKPTPGQLLEVLKYKLNYEARHGSGFLTGKTEATFAAEELERLLFDPMTFRGRRMIDVAFFRGQAQVHLRVREGSIAPAGELASEYVKEADRVFSEVIGYLGGGELAGEGKPAPARDGPKTADKLTSRAPRKRSPKRSGKHS